MRQYRPAQAVAPPRLWSLQPEKAAFYALLVLVGLGVVAFALGKPDGPAYLNFTRQEYEQALARWQGAHVREYEIEVIEDAAESNCYKGCTIDVLSEGDKATVTNIVSLSGLAGMSGVVPDTELQALTVEEQFRSVGQLLETQNAEDYPSREAQPGSMYYRVTFNPALGYPEEVEEHFFNDSFNITKWLGVYDYSDRNRTVTVKRLKILSTSQHR